ncbi:unnamed protein product [Blepharisma stoltei]|uniref:Uncharacterized protein n=1 Tax=Blepharisma stoltei TaxID=1481888 RepID=A0AAU9IVE5_9CILI|nr:unnamed protein product [Blepharisma stoltei]
MNKKTNKAVIPKKKVLEESKKTTEPKIKQKHESQKKQNNIIHAHQKPRTKINNQKKSNKINQKEESKIVETAEPSYSTLKEITDGLKQFIEEGRDTSDPPPFSLSSKSKEVLKLMNFLGEELFCLNTPFQIESLPIFSLFFQLLGQPLPFKIDEASAQCRAFFIDTWNKAALEGKLLSEILEEKINTFDFSFNNISRCGALVKGHHSKLDPNFHSNTCIIAGIIAFIVRDALVYGGVAKGEGPTKLYGYLLYKKNHISER